jgi:hypothetical protein
MNLGSLLHLQRKGVLSEHRNALLDMGLQNIYYASPAQIDVFSRAGAKNFDRKIVERYLHDAQTRGARLLIFRDRGDSQYRLSLSTFGQLED